MRTSFMLPSCNYNIHITKDELHQLMDTGYLGVLVHKVPCKTGRAIFDGEHFKTLDRKEICNNLRFLLDEGVADIQETDWHVQFLTINIDKED